MPVSTNTHTSRLGSSNNSLSLPVITLTRSSSDKNGSNEISRLDITRSVNKSNIQSGSQQSSISVDSVVSAIHSGNFLQLSDVNVDQLIRSLSGKDSKVLETIKVKSAAISNTDARLLGRLIRSSDAANIKVLIMDRNAISQDAFKHLFEALKVNKTLRELSITRSGVNDKSIKYIARALAKNTALKELDLSNNRITAQGFEVLCEALLGNRVLTRLCIQSNDIKTAGASHLASLLEKNFVIRHINIGSNGLGSDGCVLIANALRFNRSLTSLSLDLNEMGVKGASAMALALSSNHTLTHLYIPHNNIGDEGLVDICTSLRHNKSLIVLDLELNALGSGQSALGMKTLAEAIRVNTSLREINLSYNLFSSEAVQELMKGVGANSKLESILFTNCCITTDSAMAIAESLPSATGMQNIGLTQNPDIAVEAYWALAQNLDKNRSMKGIQLDYNSEDRHVLYESIQSSLTRNFLWQQAVYKSTCRILTLSRIVMLGQSMNQKLLLASQLQQQHSGWNILKRMGLGRANSSTSQKSQQSFKKITHVDSGISNKSDGGNDPIDIYAGVPNLPHGGNSSRPPSLYELQGSDNSLARQNSSLKSPKISSIYQSFKGSSSNTPPMSSTHSFLRGYNAHKVMAHLVNMPQEIFETICAFLDSEGNMSIAQIRDTIKIGGNRSTLSPHYTKAIMLEQIHHSRYIPSVGVRYNIKNGDERI
ncbi:hypothetical protein BGZ76_010081 [Entomortierella beljakovae]|nr:hypothetical protein BGZ76_010081 [Entomortierella beljakovae]